MISLQKGEWFKNRFQTMGPAEVISRLADVGRHLALRASLKSIQERSAMSVKRLDWSRRLPEINQLDGISTREQAAVMAAAGGWLNHRATFFSLKDIPLGDPIDWHRDYFSDRVSPITYSGLINARDKDRVGDIKYIWELNRLQHLVLLALAGKWTGNANYWTEIEKQVISWDKSNPFMMGLNWKSPLEAGMRIIAWAYVLFIAGTRGQETERFDKALHHTIYQHQYFIRKFYSKHSSANNHLIGEMAGLYVGSVFWPCYRESAGWRAFARRKLIQELFRQVEVDGVGKERATEYQVVILEFFLLAGALGHLIGEPFPQEYWARLQRMFWFLSAISNRAGDIPMFGDGDGGQAVWLPETTPERVQHVIGRSRLNRESIIGSDLRSTLLLWGQSRQRISIPPPSLPSRSLESFPDGGYYVLAADRSAENEMIVVFDAGPLGLPPLNAHGHADALNFWLSSGGEEFLIDPGTFTYYASAKWRSYFRGTAAHNTIRVDGKDQSVPAGTFLWRETADCRIQHFGDTDEFVEAVGFHDGYRRLPDPVIHRRSLRLFNRSRTLAITDRLECQASHDVELFFHFSEKCQVRQVGPRAFEAVNNGRRIAVRIDSLLEPQVYRGCENPIYGWVSRTFGVKEASFTLVARTQISCSADFLTEISAI